MAWNKLAWEDFRPADLHALFKAIKMEVQTMKDQTLANLLPNVETLIKCLEVEAMETRVSVEVVEEVMVLEDLEVVEALTMDEVLAADVAVLEADAAVLEAGAVVSAEVIAMEATMTEAEEVSEAAFEAVASEAAIEDELFLSVHTF